MTKEKMALSRRKWTHKVADATVFLLCFDAFYISHRHNARQPKRKTRQETESIELALSSRVHYAASRACNVSRCVSFRIFFCRLFLDNLFSLQGLRKWTPTTWMHSSSQHSSIIQNHHFKKLISASLKCKCAIYCKTLD